MIDATECLQMCLRRRRQSLEKVQRNNGFRSSEVDEFNEP